MANNQGKFIWYELMTPDSKGGAAFYCDVVGWNAQNAGMPGVDYTLLNVGSTPVAGLMDLAALGGAGQPGWLGYVAVDDVDATARRAGELGGRVFQPPTDIPNVGRFAVVADPHGAALGLLKMLNASADSPTPDTPGYPGWRELYAGDLNSAFEFYSKLFGWAKLEAVDLGPMGTYQVFGVGGEAIGGMMNKRPDTPAPTWTYYFNVDGVGAAAERAKLKSGQILFGPHEVPGGSWIVQGIDPQGAMFALISPQA
jgi:predicted enzyme related to lactoylglutathione lyase